MIDWIGQNKEWFLQGLGITILLGIFGIIKWFFNKNKNAKTREITMKGKNSTYIEKNKGKITIKK
ncbi:MAG: hypothetical protein LBI72_14515 [Flavobacteriaceae bacterium]|jgi:hypothetical protein|nr:hypothetical protein [Flavobacteriaceae bacterium]